MERINDYFEIRYVSRDKRSPVFFADCNELLRLRERQIVIVQNMYSFVTFVRKSDTVNIGFTWLNDEYGRLVGWRDWVFLSYNELMTFVGVSVQKGGPAKGRFLNLKPDDETHPHIVFCDTEQLHECLARDDVRQKLLRFLRDRFQWPGSEEIRFYNDFEPYSFGFQQIHHGKPGITGGLILHGQEDMNTAYYSIHTWQRRFIDDGKCA